MVQRCLYGRAMEVSYELMETLPGNYQTVTGEFIGCIGQTYHLNVRLEDGREYLSRSELMTPVPPVSSVDFELVVEEELNESEVIVYDTKLIVFVNTQTQQKGGQLFLKWDVQGEYQFNEWQPVAPMVVNLTCYVKDELPADDISILDGSGAVNGMISKKRN